MFLEIGEHCLLGLGGLTLSFLRGAVFGVSGRGVDVFGLGHAGKLIVVARKTAEEDPAAQHQDSGPPAEAVCPRVVVITFIDQLVELDGVDDQSDYLDDYSQNKEASDYRQQRDVEATAESHKRDDEGDDEDDEAYDHQSSDGLGPWVLHE